GHTQYEELVKVPLMIRFPDTKHAGTRIETPVRLMDLMPTVHDWLEVTPPSTFRGESFLGQIQGTGGGYSGPLYYEACLYGGEKKALCMKNLKLILDVDTDKTQLFDLQADPKEKNDLSAERAEETAKLKDALLKMSDDLQKKADQDKQALDLSKEVMKDLHGLGYM
ncbi:MAG: sulfatase/phosphatase domain-containing protein, partial [Planctomycetota bacterium]